MVEKEMNKIIGIPSRLVVPYTVPTLIKNFDFFNKFNEGCLGEVAKIFNCDKRVLDTILTYLVKENFLIVKNGIYFMSNEVKNYLTKHGSYDLSEFVLVLDGNVPTKISDDIAFALTYGKPANWDLSEPWIEAMKKGSISQQFSKGMMCRGNYLCDAFIKVLSPILQKYKTLLDIGGSLGDYSGKITENISNIMCTVVELPKVAEKTLENMVQKNYPRLDVVVGDMFADDLATGYDVHLYSNIMHDWMEDDVQFLLNKSHNSLNDGGLIIIHDMHLDNNKKGPDLVVDHSLYLSIYTEGKCYSFGEITKMMRACHFKNLESRKTAAGYSVILGRK